MIDTEISARITKLQEEKEHLARELLQIVDTADVPDSYWMTDSRIRKAREILDVPDNGRYTHDHLWWPKSNV